MVFSAKCSVYVHNEPCYTLIHFLCLSLSLSGPRVWAWFSLSLFSLHSLSFCDKSGFVTSTAQNERSSGHFFLSLGKVSLTMTVEFQCCENTVCSILSLSHLSPQLSQSLKRLQLTQCEGMKHFFWAGDVNWSRLQAVQAYFKMFQRN